MPRTKKENKEPGIHFKNADLGGYFVTCIGNNSEVLQNSEVLEVRASCEVNIAALVKLLREPNLMIIDESNGRIKRYKFSEILK